MGVRQLAVLIPVAAALAIGWLGLSMGSEAAATPATNLGDVFGDQVEVWTDRADAQVSVGWEVTDSGAIELSLSNAARVESAEPFTALVALHCDARLVQPEFITPGGGGEVELTEHGFEALCPEAGLALGRSETTLSGEPAYQLFRIPLPSGENYVRGGRDVAIGGLAHGEWTDFTLAKRIARTPMIGFSSIYGVPRALEDEEIFEAAVGSAIDVALYSQPDEVIELSVPPDGRGLTEILSTSASSIERLSGSELTVQSAYWHLETTDGNVGSTDFVGSAFARWGIPDGEARVQLLLLLSGVLLGVAASLLIDSISRTFRRKASTNGRSSTRG